MSSFDVTVKWGKESFELALDTASDVATFKQSVFLRTGVPTDKQKLVGKGVALKDDTPWSAIKGLKAGFVFMLIGQAGPLPTAPSVKTVFVEDLPEDQRVAAESQVPPGLVNLGNTCYMNSTVQALVAVPELRVALQKFRPAAGSQRNVDELFTGAMAELSRDLTFGGNAVTPDEFIFVLRQLNAQFNERDEHGFSQQDSDECLTTILQALSRQLRATDGSSSSSAGLPSTVIHQLFGVKLAVTMQNMLDAAEPAEHKEEAVLKLAAHIDKDTKYLTKCIEHSLVGEIEKMSPLTNANTVYKKTMRLARLPLVLTVQFVRFFWKAGVANKPGNKSKIVRPVEFPFTLDVLDFCTDELKATLIPVRKHLRELEDAHLGVSSTVTTGVTDASTAATSSSSTTTTTAMATDDQGEPDGKKARVDSSSEFENDTGLYELAALVTHKGRDADGGHYVAWVKEKEDQWLLYDDDRVSRVKDEDIKKLTGQGGGDWHMAYIAFYRARRLRDAIEQMKQDADKPKKKAVKH